MYLVLCACKRLIRGRGVNGAGKSQVNRASDLLRIEAREGKRRGVCSGHLVHGGLALDCTLSHSSGGEVALSWVLVDVAPAGSCRGERLADKAMREGPRGRVVLRVK